MAKKPYRSSLYQRQLHGDAWFKFYQRSLRNLVYQMFEWKGLPETINPMFTEKTLHRNGLIAFYDDPRFKEMSIIYNYMFFKYSSNSDNLIFLVKFEIYTSFE